MTISEETIRLAVGYAHAVSVVKAKQQILIRHKKNYIRRYQRI